MRFGAVYCLYDDHEYLAISLEPIKCHLAKILFLISDVPWNGERCDNSPTIRAVEQICRSNPNCEVFYGHWTNEMDQRNFGLDCLFSEGIDYSLIIDNDEIYDERHFSNILGYVRERPSCSAFHIEWNTYWKKDYYRVEPRESYKPVVMVKTDSFLFTAIRGGVTAVRRTGAGLVRGPDGYNATLIPPDVAICYHLSYARTDEFMRRKLETNSHAPEFLSNWYSDVWLKWTPEMRHLHPVTPAQYECAVREDFLTLPIVLQRFIERERLSQHF